MAIRSPNLDKYTSDEKSLIGLMANLMLEDMDEQENLGNKLRDHIVLSDRQATELLKLIESYLSTKRFMFSSHFSERVFDEEIDGNIKKLYLDAKSDGKRGLVRSSMRWEEFKGRIGLRAHLIPGSRADPMSWSHFEKMEYHLVLSCGVDERVAKSLLSVVSSQRHKIDALREKRSGLQRRAIKLAIFEPIMRSIKSTSRLVPCEVPRDKIGSAITFVADAGVMFTTRDWGVAGTISAMAGALAVTMAD